MSGNQGIPEESRFLFGNKPIVATEYDFDPKYREDHINFRSISQEDLNAKRFQRITKREQVMLDNNLQMDRSHKSPPVDDSIVMHMGATPKSGMYKEMDYNGFVNKIQDKLDKIFKFNV